jgi:hypothetical protein
LTGSKNVVPVGAQADAYLVPAMVGNAMAMFLVERSAATASPASGAD